MSTPKASVTSLLTVLPSKLPGFDGCYYRYLRTCYGSRGLFLRPCFFLARRLANADAVPAIALIFCRSDMSDQFTRLLFLMIRSSRMVTVIGQSAQCHSLDYTGERNEIQLLSQHEMPCHSLIPASEALVWCNSITLDVQRATAWQL